MEKIIEKLKSCIEEHINNGGSIYTPRRKNPYYETMRYYMLKFRELGHPNITMEDMYQLCGYTYDREYARYLEVLSGLKTYADENNFVDEVKKQRSKGGLRNKLGQLSHDLNCTPSDYLILMTDYRYSTSVIQTNYIEQLQKELLEKYPDGDISRIRRENPAIYYKLHHLFRYSPEQVGMADINALFNVHNKRSKNTPYNETLDEESVIKEVITKYNGQTVTSISQKDPDLYIKMKCCATANNKTIPQWLEDIPNIDINIRKTHADRLSRTKVDADKREKELLEAMELVRKEYSFPETSDHRQQYYQRKQIAKLALEKINEKSESMFSL